LYGQKHEKYRALLHAGVLSFAHPVTQAPLTIESPLPPDFEECLAELRTRK
jgi:23S rRNA-/tRNA-specific pseudouridylate synthase